MRGARGFGLIDVLVALLLLALSLLGGATSLVQSIRAAHAAALQTRAVDLAADLAEDLQIATTAAQAAAYIGSWRDRIPAELPVGGSAPGDYAMARAVPDAAPHPARFDVQLQWIDPADHTPVVLTLPAVSRLAGAAR